MKLKAVLKMAISMASPILKNFQFKSSMKCMRNLLMLSKWLY